MLHSSKARRGAAAALVGLLALGSWGWWMVASADAVDDVEISWSLDCAEGTEVESGPDRSVVRSQPGWRCDVEVVVANRSGTDVRVKQVQAAGLANLGRSEVRGFGSDDAELVRRSNAAGFSGWRVGEVVPAGEEHAVTVTVGWRESGCGAAGSIVLERWPTVTLEALGRTHRRTADQELRIRTVGGPGDGACVDGAQGSRTGNR